MNHLIAILTLIVSMAATGQSNRQVLLIGTYTDGCASDGIYAYEFDLDTAAHMLLGSTENVVSPSYLSVSPDNRFIYSVNENGDASTVSAMSFDGSSGSIKVLNRRNSNGASPCYIIDDPDHVIVANYSGGTIAVFGKTSDGLLSDVKQVIAHQGNGPNKERQEKAHVHMVTFSPDGKHVLATDLGTDEITIYDYDAKSATKVLTLKHRIKVKSGSGPRHLAFSPNGTFAYSIHELDGTLTAFSYRDGQLDQIQQTTIVPEGFKGEIGAADIHVSDDGMFLYATNRGDANTISAFAIAPDGTLTHLETKPTNGKGPRNFAIAPGGKFVLVAHQNSNDVIIFTRNHKTGLLQATGQKIELCAPVCLKFTGP